MKSLNETTSEPSITRPYVKEKEEKKTRENANENMKRCRATQGRQGQFVERRKERDGAHHM